MTPQDHANAEMLKRRAREQNGGFDRITYRIEEAHPAWPDEEARKTATIEPKPPVVLTAEESNLLWHILAPVADRAHKFVQAQSMTAEQEQALLALAERVDESEDAEVECTTLEKVLLAFVLRAENWGELLGLKEDERHTLEAITTKVNE